MSINWKRLMAGILASATLVGAMLTLGSCGNEADTTTTETRAEQETGGSDSAYGSLEKTKYNREFAIATRSGVQRDVKVEKITGEVLDDAVYERNVAIAEDFGVTFTYEVKDTNDEVNRLLLTQAGTSLDEYDLYIGQKQAYNTCVLGGYLYNLAEMDTLKLDQKYWDQAFNAAMNVEDKAFVATGDISPFSMRISTCMTFNKKMLDDRRIAYPYALVDSGDWTMDALLAMTTDVTNKDLGEDSAVYGFTCWTMETSYSLFYGMGGRFVALNAEKLPEIVYKNEDVINRYEKIYKLIVEQDAFYATHIDDYEQVYENFIEGRAMFCDLTPAKIAGAFGEMEDYGIVPPPKYDKIQSQYLSFVPGSVPLTMVSKSEGDPEFVGAIMDAMAAYNYDNVTPKMYESVVKLKAARDPDSPRMLDYILRNRVFDLGFLADLEITNLIKDNLGNSNPAIASKLSASARRRAENDLKTVLRKLQLERK